MKRRNFLRAGANIGIGLAGGAFVAARSGLMIASTPQLQSDGIPSEPSLLGTLAYSIVYSFETLQPESTIAQMQAAPQSNIPLPSNISHILVNASGRPAEFISAPKASPNHIVMYIHGGGFAVPANDTHRLYTAALSQATGASGFLPDYRLTPDHPFPASLNDCVTAYCWLLNQGIAASNVILIGESAGGNLVLTTTLALREQGVALPAALIAISAPTDLLMTGKSYQTKVVVDPVLGKGLPKSAFDAYTNNSTIDARNPLVSPLYADLRGLPPTLLQVGTQEVLLDDSIMMAAHMKAANVETQLEVWPGMWHAWPLMQVSLPFPESRLATQHIVKFIRRYLGM